MVALVAARHAGDTGAALVVRAELPGVEIRRWISASRSRAPIKGERNDAPPEGYSAHRKNARPSVFSRTFALPAKVEIVAFSVSHARSVTVDLAQCQKSSRAKSRESQLSEEEYKEASFPKSNSADVEQPATTTRRACLLRSTSSRMPKAF